MAKKNRPKKSKALVVWAIVTVIVLLADCAKQFNEADLREPVLVHQSLGIGGKCRDRSRGVQYDTAERTAVAVLQRREMVSEELRVLYVALTRAKEKLILTCANLVYLLVF